MKKYRVTQAANQIGVSASTLRNYTQQGRIQSELNPAGQRVYTQESIDTFLGKTQPEHHDLVFYVRASDGDEVKLGTQVEQLMSAYGEPMRVYKDKASGLNEKRSGLQSLLNAAEKGKISLVCVTQKDRLTRFGFTYLERLFGAYGVKIVVLGEGSPKSPQEELIQDFLSLLASFSGKYYRLRGHAQKKDFLNLVRKEHDEKE